MVDYSQISFPSDKITLKQMKANDPLMFSSIETLDKVHAADIDAITLHRWEMELVEHLRKHGSAESASKAMASDLDEIEYNLTSGYIEYGFCPGEQAAQQMVQRLKTQVASLIQGNSGKQP